jgi:hypothetical protein
LDAPGATSWLAAPAEPPKPLLALTRVLKFTTDGPFSRASRTQSCDPAQPMKLVITSDLHQRIAKWDDLVPIVETERPRFVLIAGDLLPKDTFKQQKAFFAVMRRLFQAL